MSNILSNQSSSKQKFYIDFQKMLILKAANVLTFLAFMMSSEKQEAEVFKAPIIKSPEKRTPIEFDKTVDLMLGIEENSL